MKCILETFRKVIIATVNSSIRSQPSLYICSFLFYLLPPKKTWRNKPKFDYEMIAFQCQIQDLPCNIWEETNLIFCQTTNEIEEKMVTGRGRASHRSTNTCKSESFTWSVIATQPPGDARLIECALHYLSPWGAPICSLVVARTNFDPKWSQCGNSEYLEMDGLSKVQFQILQSEVREQFHMQRKLFQATKRVFETLS